MKKDKAVKNAERKAAIINKVKSLIGPFALLAIILVGVLVAVFYKTEEEPEEVIELNGYSGREEELVLENDKLVMKMDSTNTQFCVEVKENGAMWYSNPQNVDDDQIALKLDKEKLKSTLLLTYSTKNGVDTLFNNYAYSMEKGIYNIEQGEDYIKVFYSLGDTEKEYVIPTIVEKSRMDAYVKKMDKEGSRRTLEYYKKYDINKLGKKDNKEELLAKYPMLETQVIYVLRDTTKDNIKGKLEEYFATAGYTYEDYLQDKELAGAGEASDKPVFNVNVVYRLEEDRLVVEVPLNEIEYKKDYPIYELNVLPYFGAGGVEDEGYLLVPEGGGALINFNNGKTAQNSYYANLYGWDRAQNRDAVVHETETYFNAFGIARNGSSFLCTLEEGAPYAAVTADISGKSTSFNYVSAQYTLVHRDVYEMGERYEGKMYVYQEALPNEKLVQSYRFIDSDDYVDMAMAYRSYIEEQAGEYLTAVEDTQTPTVVEIVGAVDKVKQVAGIPMSRPLALTTFQEAQDIITGLQQDGLQNISVKMTGWMNGGVQQKILDDVKLVSDLGSKKDLKQLVEYANANGVDFYLDGITDYAYDSDILDGFFVFTDAARFVSKEKAEIYPYSTVTYSAREGQDPHYLLRGTVIPEMIDNLVEEAGKYNANVSFAELGKELNSDFYRKNPMSRQQVMLNQVERLKQIQAGGQQVMINMGNNYAMAYCDMVTNMDLDGSAYSILDKAVPVYQMAWHGYVNYTGEAMNLTQNMEDELLKSAEYGAGLAFTLMDESAFTLQNTLYTQYFGAQYAAWHEKLVEIYSRYNKELGHTFNQRMVNHEIVTENLSCTEYEDGTKVYVNYSYETKTTPEGNQVQARDYFVMK
ncbi:MAG: hypothetical protein IJO85_00565 [Lachnospiraceae bacterium]|nr:hypothetical protein [Lachnospiraceae bacterium]